MFFRSSFSTANASGMRLERLIDDRLLVGELTDQVVQAVGCGDDVAFLVVEVADELVELPEQASQILLATGERGAQRLGDVLNLTEAAAVEHHRHCGQRLFGRRVGAGGRQRDQGSRLSLPIGGCPCGRRQFYVHRTQQAGLTERGRRVGRKVDVAVELHGDQRMPALQFDVGHVADGDIVDPDPGILFKVLHVGHLRLDGVGARAAAFGARQRERVRAVETAAGQRGRDQQRHEPGGNADPVRQANHRPPPGGAIIPRRPSAGLVGTGCAPGDSAASGEAPGAAGGGFTGADAGGGGGT